MSAPGFFLVLEGPEGAGKSTLGAALAARLRAAGIEPVLVREPGGTPVAERVREMLLDPAIRIDGPAELLLMTAARASLVAEVIGPALAAGRTVISDRFDLSTMAYQIAGRGLDRDMVTEVNRAATGGLTPDLTLVLDVPLATGWSRQETAGKSRDRMERESGAFHQRVAAAYLAATGPAMRHLDGARPPAAVLDDAWRVLSAARPETFGGASG